MHAPATIDKFKLLVIYQLARQILDLVCLLIPPYTTLSTQTDGQLSPASPASKKTNLNKYELPVGVFVQTFHDSVQDVVHIIKEVLVDRHLRANASHNSTITRN